MRSLSLMLVALAMGLSLTSAGPEVPAKVFKKIANHQLSSSCWGEQNMMDFYRLVKHFQKECFDLKPTFDINLFDDNQYDPKYMAFDTRNTYQPILATSSFALPQQPILPTVRYASSGSQPVPAISSYDTFLAYLRFQNEQQKKYSPLAFSRYRRAAHAYEQLTHEQIAEFGDDFDMFKSDMEHNIGNLTCMLSKMQILDSQLQINMTTHEKGMWEDMKQPVDPELKAKAIDGYRSCYQVAQSIPQDVLNRKAITRQFGRQMIFFKCTRKMERGLCAKNELKRWLEAWHGPITKDIQHSLGLPEDKLDAAMLAFKIMDHSRTSTEKFIGKFFFDMEEK